MNLILEIHGIKVKKTEDDSLESGGIKKTLCDRRKKNLHIATLGLFSLVGPCSHIFFNTRGGS